MSKKVYIASDHAGFIKKNELVEILSKNFDVVDLGPKNLDPNDDYPIYAQKVAESVADNKNSFGILVCKSGEGMEIAANKIDGVRAALVWNKHLALETRQENDSNVLSLPSGEISLAEMVEISKVFLSTLFSKATRHKRRISEINEIEKNK